MKKITVVLLVVAGICYFRTNIFVTLKNNVSYTKDANSLVFIKDN